MLKRILFVIMLSLPFAAADNRAYPMPPCFPCQGPEPEPAEPVSHRVRILDRA
jgi:hypothetical protein